MRRRDVMRVRAGDAVHLRRRARVRFVLHRHRRGFPQGTPMNRSTRWLALALVIATVTAVPAQTPPPERALARDILQQLIAIPTTAENGVTPRAAQALAERLTAAGFPAGDV